MPVTTGTTGTPMRPNRPDRHEQPDRPERPDRPDRPERPDRPDRPENPDRPNWGPPSPSEPSQPPGWRPPMAPGNPNWGQGNNRPIWRPIITIPGITIRPNVNNRPSSAVRFINAAVGCGPVSITVNDNTASSYLDYSNMTDYQYVTGGYANVVVRSSNTNRVINRTNFQVEDGGVYTIALVNSADGVALFLIEDTSCSKSIYNSCLRVVNLTNRSPALDVMMTNGRTLFDNVRFLDVTEYQQFAAGTYSFTVSTSGSCGAYTANALEGTGRGIQLIPVIIGIVGGNCGRDALVTGNLEIRQNKVYTLYLIGNAYSSPQIQMILAESYLD